MYGYVTISRLGVFTERIISSLDPIFKPFRFHAISVQPVFVLPYCSAKFLFEYCEGARGVIVTVLENGHGDTSSNPGQDW